MKPVAFTATFAIACAALLLSGSAYTQDVLLPAAYPDKSVTNLQLTTSTSTEPLSNELSDTPSATGDVYLIQSHDPCDDAKVAGTDFYILWGMHNIIEKVHVVKTILAQQAGEFFVAPLISAEMKKQLFETEMGLTIREAAEALRIASTGCPFDADIMLSAHYIRLQRRYGKTHFSDADHARLVESYRELSHI